MTRADIEGQIEATKAQIDKLSKELVMCEGALQVLDHQLAKINARDEAARLEAEKGSQS